MAQDFPLQGVLVTEGRSRNTIRGSMCALKGKRQAQGAPSTVCPLKTPNKAPQDVKDKHFSIFYAQRLGEKCGLGSGSLCVREASQTAPRTVCTRKPLKQGQ